MVFDGHGRRAAIAVSAGILLGGLNVVAVANAAPDTESTSVADDAATARGPQRSPGGPARSPVSGSRADSARGTTLPSGASDGTVRRDRGGARTVVSPNAAQPRDEAPRPAGAARDESAPAVVSEPVATPTSPTAMPNMSAPVAVSEVPGVSEIPAAPEVPAAPAGSSAPSVSRPAAVTISAPIVAPRPPDLAAALSIRPGAIADALAQGSGAPLPSALAWAVMAAARSEVGRRGGAVVPAAAVASIPTEPVGQDVSPLGTPEQIAAETAAMQTACTLPVLAMKAVLGLAWRMIGHAEYTLVGGPDKANLAALGDAVDEWAMSAAFQLMILNSNAPTIVAQVAPPHRWYGVDVTGSRILYDNPDTIYRFVGVNYASEYVITGRLPDDDPKASFSVLTGTTGTTVAVLDADRLELGPDRSFVITVSGDPAQPGEKNHLQITPDTTLIAIRDTLSQWTVQSPMSLAVHRTAGPPNSLFSQFGGFALPGIGPLVSQSEFLTALVSLIPPLPAVPPIVRGSYAALLMLRGVSEESKYIKVATTDPVTGKRKAPNVFTDPTSNASFLATQLQSAGYFQLADDEALVLTINPNNAGYFVAPVTNDWTITDNYWDQQTSLNNAQAKPNPDGSYTLVVSPTEPTLAGGLSVWNWVSTGGLNQGTMAIRFQSIDPQDPSKPTVSSQVVPISALNTVLPPGTTFVTAGERAAQIAARAEGFNRRFAPYPQTSLP